MKNSVDERFCSNSGDTGSKVRLSSHLTSDARSSRVKEKISGLVGEIL